MATTTMQKLARPLAVLAAALAAACALAGDIAWEKGYEAALAKAKKSNRLTMIFFHADWCTYCQRMKKTTLKDAGVHRALEGVVPVAINIDQVDETFKKRFNVKMYPAFVFVAPDGKKFGELNGFVGPTLFRDEVKKFSVAFRDEKSLLAAYHAKPGDGETNARLAWLYGIKREASSAEKHLANAKRAGYKGPYLARAQNMIGDIYQLSGKADVAITHFLAALNATNDLEDRSYALVSLMCCSFVKGDRASSARYGKQLISMKGANPEYVAFAKEELRKRGIEY